MLIDSRCMRVHLSLMIRTIKKRFKVWLRSSTESTVMANTLTRASASKSCEVVRISKMTSRSTSMTKMMIYLMLKCARCQKSSSFFMLKIKIKMMRRPYNKCANKSKTEMMDLRMMTKVKMVLATTTSPLLTQTTSTSKKKLFYVDTYRLNTRKIQSHCQCREK